MHNMYTHVYTCIQDTSLTTKTTCIHLHTGYISHDKNNNLFTTKGEKCSDVDVVKRTSKTATTAATENTKPTDSNATASREDAKHADASVRNVPAKNSNEDAPNARITAPSPHMPHSLIPEIYRLVCALRIYIHI
jgi:hypothetical protein